jgi:hypothetical protein
MNAASQHSHLPACLAACFPPLSCLLLARRWTAVPESDWPAEEAQRSVIMADFDLAPGGGYGDRRQVRAILGWHYRLYLRGRVCLSQPLAPPRLLLFPNPGVISPAVLSSHAVQEIVFIGASMDRAAIELQLDSAMLTDAGRAGCGEVYVAGQE